MKDWRSLAHTKWECKYHIVFVPKYRKKALYGKTRRRIGEILRELCRHKDVTLLEGHTMPDHIHMCLSIPPKYSVAMVVGYLEGKSAIRIHPEIMGINRGFTTISLIGITNPAVGNNQCPVEISESKGKYFLLSTAENDNFSFGDISFYLRFFAGISLEEMSMVAAGSSRASMPQLNMFCRKMRAKLGAMTA